jgi:magnesium transporter
MKAIKLIDSGELEDIVISKKEMAEKFELNIRDLRPVYSILQVATFLPRKNVLIINLGKYKVIVSKNEAYFMIHVNNDEVKDFVKTISYKIKERKTEHIFYLFILEQILDAKYKEIKEKNSAMLTEANSVLDKIRKSFHEKDLEPLVRIKKRVLRNESKLAEILSAIKEVLDDEENFNELVSLGDNYKLNSFEAESVLENFLEELEDEIGNLFQIKETLEHGQEIIDLTLSIRRTKIGRIDLFATITTLIMGILAVVVGLYGVNLKNHLEDSDTAFFILTFSLVIFIILSGVLSV